MAAAVAVTLAGSLTACGGSERGAEASDYCTKGTKASAAFKGLAADHCAQLVDSYHELADAAPSEIDADWKELDDTMTTVDLALRSAGTTFADLSETAVGGTPEGVDQSKVQDLRTATAALSSPEFAKAATKIEAHAKETCHIDLGKSS